MKHAGEAALEVLSRGVMSCPDCTAQREARLKADNQVSELTVALARAIYVQRDVAPATIGRTWADEFERITGQGLQAFVDARRKR